MSNESPELKPCPFCGSDSIVWSDPFQRVRCNGCYIGTPTSNPAQARTDESTAALKLRCFAEWNARVPTDGNDSVNEAKNPSSVNTESERQSPKLLPATEMIDRELVHLAFEAHARIVAGPYSKALHERVNELHDEILRRLAARVPTSADACVVCSAELLPPTEPPHCENCVVTDDNYHDWESSVSTRAKEDEELVPGASDHSPVVIPKDNSESACIHCNPNYVPKSAAIEDDWCYCACHSQGQEDKKTWEHDERPDDTDNPCSVCGERMPINMMTAIFGSHYWCATPSKRAQETWEAICRETVAGGDKPSALIIQEALVMERMEVERALAATARTEDGAAETRRCAGIARSFLNLPLGKFQSFQESWEAIAVAIEAPTQVRLDSRKFGRS